MEKTVFTNGCFDLLHPGHIDLLRRARALGSRLIVAINSDASVRRIKGDGRPFMNQDDRAEILSALRFVDEVVVFDEATPERLIRELKPDVLVKGGDWKTSEIIGADFVLANGGEVHSLPLVDGYSSSNIVEGIRSPGTSNGKPVTDSIAGASLRQHVETIEKVISQSMESVEACARLLVDTLMAGRKVLVFGNGGSAADAQHIAAELVGRYEKERRGLPAIALTTDTSALTAVSNDYGFERVFVRQVEALASSGDLAIAISTSGNSPNIISAVMAARQAGCKVIGMTGSRGKKLASLCDECVMVPESRTARIQEAHITIAHIWCEILDERMEADTRTSTQYIA
jgi:D-sedoheptulose 7-phosphate isomerase